MSHVVLYHPSGAAVTLDVTDLPEETVKAQAGHYFRAVSSFIEAGFLVQPPGLEEGEQKEMIGYVVRREHENKDTGKVTQMLDLYGATDGQNKFKFIKAYLDTDEWIAAFEAASGLTLTKLPIYEGTGDIERGKDRRMDQKVIKCPRSFQIVWKINQKYDEAAAKASKPGEYMIPKKRFIRFVAGKTPAPAAAKAEEKPIDQLVVNWWIGFFSDSPPVNAVNERLDEITRIEADHGRPTLIRVKTALKEYADNCSWEYDQHNKVFVAPVDPPGFDDQGGYDPDQSSKDPLPF